VGITTGQRGVNTDVGTLVQRQFDSSERLNDGNADDGMSFNVVANRALGQEETGNTKQDEDGQEPPDSSTNRAPLLLLAGIGTSLAAESTPEAAPLIADCKFDVGFVDRIGWQTLLEDELLLVDRIVSVSHERSGGRHCGK